jgi:integrase
MINRNNYLLIRDFKFYLRQTLLLTQKSIDRNWFYLRHLLIWAGSIPFDKMDEIEPAFPYYVQNIISPRTNQPIANQSKKRITESAIRFFKWTKMNHSRKYQYLSDDMIPKYNGKISTSSPKDHDFVSLDEILQIVKSCPDKETLPFLRDRAATAMLYLSGMRIGAFVTLPIKSVNIPKRTIYQYPDWGVETKNGNSAITYLLEIPELIEIVEKWDLYIRQSQPDTSMWYTPIDGSWGDYHLSNEKTGMNRTANFRKRLAKLSKTIGFDIKSAHKFRHGHAVYGLLHAKCMADYHAISRNLMHESIETTDKIYAGLNHDDLKARITGLSKIVANMPDDDLRQFLAKLDENDTKKAIHICMEMLDI